MRKTIDSSFRILCTAVCLCSFGILGTSEARAQGLFEQAVSGDLDTENTDEETPESGEKASSGLGFSTGGFNFELNGYIRGDMYMGRIPESDSAEIKSGYGEAALKLRVRKGSYGNAYSEIRLRQGYEYGEPVTEFDLREAYINLFAGPFDFRLGQQIVVWGRADAMNPTDNVTPRSMRVKSPDEDDRRLSNFALRTFFNMAPVRLEGVWVPFFRPSELPPVHLEPTIHLDTDAGRYPDANVKNGTFAGRFHLELPAFEASVSYLYGHATFPGVVFEDAAVVDNNLSVAITTAAYTHQVVGFDFAATAGDWFGLRGEAAYKRPFGYGGKAYIPNPDIQAVLGIDREFFGEFSVIAQYYGRYVFHHRKAKTTPTQEVDPSTLAGLNDETLDSLVAANSASLLLVKNQMIAGQQEEWQHSAIVRLEWKLLQETLSLETLGMVNFVTEEVMLRPKVTYDITDAFTFTAGAEVYLGPDDSLYGSIEEVQSAGFVELMISF